MEEYPMTFDEFIRLFITEEQCRDYLYRIRWPMGFVCQGFIEEHVEIGSTIITDDWSSYISLKERGYMHTVPKKFEVADPENILPHVRTNPK